jgi:hypothetical protein
VCENLNYSDMSKSQKKDHDKKFKDAQNNFKWIKDKGYKLFKASGGYYSDWEKYENIFLKGKSQNISSEDLLNPYNSVNSRRKSIEEHTKKFKDARNNYNWIKDNGYKLFKASGGYYSDWEKYEKTFNGKEAKDISSDELSEIYTSVNSRRKSIEEHTKKFKDARNNYNWIKDNGGYTTYIIAGGNDNDWKLIGDTFKDKTEKDISSDVLTKVYPIVNDARKKVEEYQKNKNQCPGTSRNCLSKNFNALINDLGDSITNTAKLFISFPKLITSTVNLYI